MNITKYQSSFLSESYTLAQLPNGLKIYVLEKPDYASAYAVFGTKYGSVNIKFRTDKTKDFIEVPAGIAHFLEHKLFESEEGDAFEKFAQFGAYANAYTSFDRTGYLFSCTEEFESNLRHLLSFVSDPYFTEETVAKEQGIIGQEIKMYDDSPDWRVFFNLLTSIYHNHPVRTDIAGTVESIAQITPQLLYDCYNTFYHPSNMYLCVAGNVKTEEVLRIAEEIITTEGAREIENFVPQEPREVKDTYCEQQLDVAKPLFAFGYKMDPEESTTPKARVATELLLEVLAGHSSKLYTDLLKEELVNPEFSSEHFTGSGYSVIMFSGESASPKLVAQKIKQRVSEMLKEGIDPEAFKRAKRKNFGQTVMMFNSVEGLSSALTECAMRGEELFDFEEIYAEVSQEDLIAVLSQMKEEFTSLSVINPKE